MIRKQFLLDQKSLLKVLQFNIMFLCVAVSCDEANGVSTLPDREMFLRIVRSQNVHTYTERVMHTGRENYQKTLKNTERDVNILQTTLRCGGVSAFTFFPIFSDSVGTKSQNHTISTKSVPPTFDVPDELMFIQFIHIHILGEYNRASYIEKVAAVQKCF